MKYYAWEALKGYNSVIVMLISPELMDVAASTPPARDPGLNL